MLCGPSAPIPSHCSNASRTSQVQLSEDAASCSASFPTSAPQHSPTSPHKARVGAEPCCCWPLQASSVGLSMALQGLEGGREGGCKIVPRSAPGTHRPLPCPHTSREDNVALLDCEQMECFSSATSPPWLETTCCNGFKTCGNLGQTR